MEILNYLEETQLCGRCYCCLHLAAGHTLFHLDFLGEASSSSPATEVHHLQVMKFLAEVECEGEQALAKIATFSSPAPCCLLAC